ncbi:MAG: 2-phosphosulfolactate phosphatase [Aggregatilineales bacterium]
MTWFDQHAYEIRCEWGAEGIDHLAPVTDVFVIVDVMSFSSCVSIATGRGAVVYPFASLDQVAHAFATSQNAILATRENGLLLSPSALMTLEADTRLVLPSPNGSTLTTLTGDSTTLTGCLRNAAAVAERAGSLSGPVTVIPAGERWKGTGTLRPAIEDWIGAGAIIHHMHGKKSPEAQLAEQAFLFAQNNLAEFLLESSSARELLERGGDADLALILDLNADSCAPLLVDGAYTV